MSVRCTCAADPELAPRDHSPTCVSRLHQAPIDWPARLRAAAEVADGETQLMLASLARRLERYPYAVEAIGRALLGEEDRQR